MGPDTQAERGSRPPRMRETLLRLALASGSLLVVFVLAEIAVRLAGLGGAGALVGARLSDARRTVLLDCYPSNPRGVFRIDLRSPENRGRYANVAPRRYDSVAARAPWAVESRYNELGFRERPFGGLPPDRLRIGLVGDSFTEGQGVEAEDTAARVLGRLLEARAPGRFDVLNCGRRGSDFPELLTTLDDCLRADPGVVVYLMVLNDGEQTPQFRQRQSFVNDWILLRGREEETSGPLDSRLVALVRGRIDAFRVGRETTVWYREMYGEPNRAGFERTVAHIREMDERVRGRGGRFAVALWPLLVGLEGAYPFGEAHHAIRSAVEGARIPFVDLREALAGTPTAQLWVHPLDHHPNERAQALAAAALAEPVLALAP